VTYYVLFFIHLESRKVDIAGITVHPNERWMQQMARLQFYPGFTWTPLGMLIGVASENEYTFQELVTTHLLKDR
jgi:hypothetical protein